MSVEDFNKKFWLDSDGNFYVANANKEVFLLDQNGDKIPISIPKIAPEHNWVIDRTKEHIRRYYAGDFSDEVKQRALITSDVIRRWRDNIKVIVEILNYYHISIKSASNLVDTVYVEGTYPDKPVILEHQNIIYPDNAIQRMIYFMEETLRVLDINTSDLTLPKTVEYLHFSQVNSLEKAFQRICIKLNSLSDSTQTMYCGKLISGGIITQ